MPRHAIVKSVTIKIYSLVSDLQYGTIFFSSFLIEKILVTNLVTFQIFEIKVFASRIRISRKKLGITRMLQVVKDLVKQDRKFRSLDDENVN